MSEPPPGYRRALPEEVADLLGRNAVNRIGAFLGSRGLGGFTLQLLYAGTIARMYGEDCSLSVIYRNDRPFKNYLAGLLKYRIDRIGSALYTSVGVPLDHELPVDWFDVGAFPTAVCPYDWWYKRMVHRPKLFLMPAMFDHPGFLPGVIALHIPSAEVEDSTRRLIDLGVAPDRWFVTLHMVEDEASGQRRVRRDSYRDAVRLILDRGGQVVRIGAGPPDPFVTGPGLVDLTGPASPFDLQCFALSRARFHLGTDAGPAQLSAAFKTPTLITNAVRRAGINACDVVLPKRRAAPLDGETLVDNTAAEICRATDVMLARTADCSLWRGDQSDDPIAVHPQLRWPIPRSSSRPMTITEAERDGS